ncbi:hypothetical protein EW146_g8074 [Bondarzewia mesenterica]|uniref:DUF4139 domain-containing protein n=1 Tax=Bondarzewia mesenterica TaxID=1095465 RepID=A0A4S4LHH8_9AGAM|nr:hypothetical protein EW146_g8074 [Bondarzewia mesenterica]
MSSVITVDAAKYPLRSVTVFKSAKAEVVRTFKLSFQKGQNKAEIRGLSSSLDTESVRINGLGNVQLFDVVCTIGKANSNGPDSLAEVIRGLEAKKAAIVAEKKAISDAKDVLDSYSKTLKGDDVSPEQADGFVLKYIERMRALVKVGAELDEQILQLSRQIEKETTEGSIKQGKTNGEVTVVVMAKEAAEVELKLIYVVRNAMWLPTYELHATTDAGKPASTVSLHYRVRITQSTGEDWTNVALTLSTAAMDSSDQHIPALKPIRIRPPLPKGTNISHGAPAVFDSFGGPMQLRQQQIQQMPQQQQQQRQPVLFHAQRSAGAGLFGNANTPQPLQPQFGFAGLTPSAAQQPLQAQPTGAIAFGSANASAGSEDSEEWEEATSMGETPPPAFTEPTTVVKESPLSVSYLVEGESSIPSDGLAHKVSVAELKFEAQVAHVAVPHEKAVAYLQIGRTFSQAAVKNTSDYRLLPGSVNVFLDDSYVSKTSIHDIAPGDTFDCTLGPDSSTRITYTRQSKLTTAQASAFTEQFNTTTYTSRVTVHNQHNFALGTFIIRDALPVSDDEKRVKVILRRPSVLAEAKEGEKCDVKDGLKVRWMKAKDGKGGRKEGMFEWIWNVDAGKEVTIETEWDVKASADVRWVEAA